MFFSFKQWKTSLKARFIDKIVSMGNTWYLTQWSKPVADANRQNNK